MRSLGSASNAEPKDRITLEDASYKDIIQYNNSFDTRKPMNLTKNRLEIFVSLICVCHWEYKKKTFMYHIYLIIDRGGTFWMCLP